jgi:hypothetical protein
MTRAISNFININITSGEVRDPQSVFRGYVLGRRLNIHLHVYPCFVIPNDPLVVG